MLLALLGGPSRCIHVLLLLQCTYDFFFLQLHFIRDIVAKEIMYIDCRVKTSISLIIVRLIPFPCQSHIQ